MTQWLLCSGFWALEATDMCQFCSPTTDRLTHAESQREQEAELNLRAGPSSGHVSTLHLCCPSQQQESVLQG